MTTYRHRIFFGLILMHDLCIGICLLFWPGLWHEMCHGWIVRTTFYVVQGLGAVALTRGLLFMFWRRRDELHYRWAFASSWISQAVLCGILAISLSGEPIGVSTLYILWGLLAGICGFSLIRSASSISS